jgi:parallel beta-helix repeat protein
VRDTVARNTSGYGISGFMLEGVRFLDNEATGNSEPGFYIGDSPHADAEVIGNTASHNGAPGGGEGFGILIRDSNHG